MKNTNDNWLNDLRRERLQSTSRNPGAAALMSFFVMGMGQIYAGHIDRGIMLMGFHFSGIFSAYSLYNNGILYDTLFPYLGAHLIVMCSYVASVFFILLWIYNIKDAYYLSLFASFRDWFEVERVLLPILKEQPGGLLTGSATGLLTDEDYQEQSAPQPQPAFAAAGNGVSEPVSAPDNDLAAAATIAEDAEEADVLEFRIDRKTQPKKLEKRRPEEKSETAHVVSGRDFEAISAYGSSWRLYAGLIVIFILVGVWFNNRQGEHMAQPGSESTLFAVSAEIGKADTIPVSVDNSLPAPVSDIGNEALATTASAPASVSALQPAEPASDDAAPAVKPFEPPFMRGLELARNGSLAEAAVMFEEDLQKADPSEDVWKIVLNTFYRTDNKVAYELNLRRYLKKYSNDAAAWFNLGKLLYDRNELIQAAQAIAGGLKADPDNVRGNFLLGSIYSDLKLYEDSAVYLARAVSLEPLNIEFNRMLARSLAAAGKSQEAVKYYQRVNSLAPDDKEARQAMAAARPEMAMAFSADDTDDNQVLVVMGKSESRLVEKNREELPVQQSGKVLYEIPDADGDTEPVTVESEPAPVSKPEPVSEAASEIVQPSSADASPVQVVQPVDAKASEPKALEEVLLNAASKPDIAEPKPEASTIPKGSGISELEAARTPVSAVKGPDSAERNELRDTVAVPESHAKKEVKRSRIEEYRQKGSFEFSRGNWEAALPHYLNILKEKKDPQTYDIVGLIFEKLSMHQDAFDAVEHAYNLGMRDSATLAKLGRLAEMNGDYKKGEYYLYHALQKIPHRVDLRIRYARCLEANGRENIALHELNKIVKASGDSYAVRRRAELEIQKIRSRKQN
ncbi:MAG: hypothetical protein CVV42_04330 [Candidatus Riflebacteria bacterium HGW-Riflebacteria-2]|nr:MAG: hypothetical protein CVV42_04330 [Candidatus Riflebacteria bacterium HGW-Riflebacteria-2]